MKKQPTFEQEKAIYNLNTGDIIKCKCGAKEYEIEFVDYKLVNMVCIMDNKTYNFPKSSFVEVIRKAEIKLPSKINLKVGELFIINQNGKAILFSFLELRNGYILGKSPITKGDVRIDVSMFVDSIKNIQKEVKESLLTA